MAGDMTVRLGTVVGEAIVWDVDLSRLWDGVAWWGARQLYQDGVPVEVCRLWDGVALWVALGQLETVGIWRLNPAGPAVPWILVPRW